MSTPYSDCARTVRRLYEAVVSLERAGGLLQLEPLAGREWYELLTRKLLPQLADDAYLVAAVVGGTNIGKSVIFNHIAGSRASATSPLASGTKHPVCLLPPGFEQSHDLASVFQGFTLRQWADAEAPLEEQPADYLYWQNSPQVPPNLLVLDTPDIDSDARVNWKRADNIRRCADVLIAVLTQQKYNDAAVKQFFRKAAEEDKGVIVVFNQCQLPEDEAYWPMWLDTFCRETQIVPEFVYIVPNDRRAAEENRLPFFLRQPPAEIGRSSSPAAPQQPGCSSLAPAASPGVGEDVSACDAERPVDESHSLTEDLSQLHFGEIKVRALRGSLKCLLAPENGVPDYLMQIRLRSGEFQTAAELLLTHKLAEIDNWPPVPNGVLTNEIRNWWRSQRSGWSAKVHSFYNTLGSGLAWPVRFANEKLRGPQTPPLELYRQREWNVVLDAVGKVYEKLGWFSQLGNKLLEPRLQKLLGGTSRVELLRILEQAHAAVDLQAELEQLVATEMRTFQYESPQLYSLLRQLDQVAAAARPAVSVALMFTGFLSHVGNVAAQLAVDSVTQTVVHVAGDVATGTAAAAVGDTALSSTTASSTSYIQAKVQNLYAAFAARRAGWLSAMLKEHLLGSLPEELAAAASMPRSDAFVAVQSVLQELSARMQQEAENSTA